MPFNLGFFTSFTGSTARWADKVEGTYTTNSISKEYSAFMLKKGNRRFLINEPPRRLFNLSSKFNFREKDETW